MRKVVVLGLGHTNFCFNSPKTGVEMLAEAAVDAILDSNLSAQDIQSAYIGNVLGTFCEGQATVSQFACDDIGCLNIPAIRYEGACASGSIAIREAFMWVASGFYDIVLVGGVEKATAMGTSLATRTFCMGTDSKYEFGTGLTFPGFFALLTRLYATQYNLPLSRLKEQMASVSVQSHKYGMKNPHAQIKQEISVDDVLKSMPVCTPLNLHDCCPFSDGAAAAVLCSEEAALKISNKKPVYISGIGLATSGKMTSQYKYLPRLRARELAARQSYQMTGFRPEDIDVCELHDCFSIASFIAAEGLGFFEPGKAGEAWEKGAAAIGGKTPINISGGLKAKGHPIGATGVSQLYHITKQLRGELAEDGVQVDGARIGMVDTLGGDGCICNLILTVDGA
ncbi:acetyl-coa acetyltransferase [hydrocarbon metagenome]|uniref:Acetyl-coa acetyltransferase n=1 Tax=hydrocarbon metagenome TaxID=938273 RepID=A0A0W8E290_9ZZZZ